VGGEPGGTSGSIHGLGCLFSALRREGLIADELVLQLATFLRSLDLFLELTVRTVPRTLTTNQVRRGGKQGTDDPELSRIHSRIPTRQTAGCLNPATTTGRFAINGTPQAAGQAIDVHAAQLDQTSFVAGSAVVSRAFDGWLWSDWHQLNVTGLA